MTRLAIPLALIAFAGYLIGGAHAAIVVTGSVAGALLAVTALVAIADAQ